MKFTIAYYFTRCYETAYKIERGDKILMYNNRIYCAVSPTYREQMRLKREREIRSELSEQGLDVSLLALSELITLRTQLLNSK